MSDHKEKTNPAEILDEQTEILELLHADVDALTDMFRVIKLTCESMNKPWANLEPLPSKDEMN